MMAKDYCKRAAQLFGRAAEDIRGDVDRILADHAAKHLLQSGATIKVSVRAFEARTRSALETLQGEFSAQLDSRGREWRRAMDALTAALNSHIANAPEILSKALKVASGNVGPGPMPRDGAIFRAFEGLVEGLADRLREEQKAYRDEWTAPPGKSWVERNKIKFALFSAVGGILLGKAADILFARLAETTTHTFEARASQEEAGAPASNPSEAK